MSGFGTDVVALTCILCGAGVGGAATFALMDVQDEMDVRCAVATVEESPRVVVAIGGDEGAIMVRPRVRVHTSHDCASVRIHEAGVQIHEQVLISQAIELEEQIQLSLEMVEGEMERVQVHIEEIQLEKLEALESALEHEMEQLEERLEKSGGEF
jgi:hypothetical protein